jgi:hypothetical protein
MDFRGKIHLIQGFIQLVVESAGLGLRHFIARYPKLALAALSLGTNHARPSLPDFIPASNYVPSRRAIISTVC